jgi:hypothetical protein
MLPLTSSSNDRGLEIMLSLATLPLVGLLVTAQWVDQSLQSSEVNCDLLLRGQRLPTLPFP